MLRTYCTLLAVGKGEFECFPVGCVFAHDQSSSVFQDFRFQLSGFIWRAILFALSIQLSPLQEQLVFELIWTGNDCVHACERIILSSTAVFTQVTVYMSTKPSITTMRIKSIDRPGWVLFRSRPMWRSAPLPVSTAQKGQTMFCVRISLLVASTTMQLNLKLSRYGS